VHYKKADPLVNRYGRPSKVALELANMRQSASAEFAQFRTQLAALRDDLKKIGAVNVQLDAVLGLLKVKLRKIERDVSVIEFQDGQRR
jgi:hypothetical protein